MSHDTVQLAQLNRNANNLGAQKDPTSLHLRRKRRSLTPIEIVFDAGHFATGKAQRERRRARTQVRNRLSEFCNEARHEMDKSKRVFWVIWSSD